MLAQQSSVLYRKIKQPSNKMLPVIGPCFMPSLYRLDYGFRMRYKRGSAEKGDKSMTMTSYKINDKLYINSLAVPASEAAKPVETDSNHLICIDCSGSMTSELPLIREQLKTKLKTMVKENDTVSIVWFSGRGEFGTLIEGEKIATLSDLKTVNAQIDRWLKPIGLTGFKEPMLEVALLAGRLAAKYPGNAASLLFMSDGCDNTWNKADILAAVDKAAEGLAAAAFIEYGYYADRPLLTAMAERAGGTLVHASDFDKYEATLVDVLARRQLVGKKVEVKLPNLDFIGGIAFSLSGRDVNTYAIDGGKVQVSEGTGAVWFLSPTGKGDTVESIGKEWEPTPEQIDAVVSAYTAAEEDSASSAIGTRYDVESISKRRGNDVALAATYAAISLFATRMKPEIVRPLLKATGDVAMIESYTNCFGKQAYSAFMDTAKAAAFGAGRWTKGWDPNKVPADDAFTVLDLLKLLASDDDNRVLLNHEAFKYNKIGRGRVDANTVLTADEQAEVESLTAQMNGLRDPKELKKLTARLDEITNKPEALKFEETKDDNGYPVSALTYNEERPNVSVLVKKTGYVNLASRKDKPTNAPMEFETFIYRNYAIVKDGLVNVATLPTKLSAKTIEALTAQVKAGKLTADVFKTKGKVVDGAFKPDEVVIDLTKLPVINALMVNSCSAKSLFTAEYELTKAKAAQKVYNSYLKEKKPEGKKSEGWEAQYGAETAAWLKGQGFTEYSGFAPKSVVADAVDFYMAKEMSVSLKGLASLPTLKDVKDRMAKGKLTASAAIMAPFVIEVENETGGAADDAVVSLLEQKADEQKTKVRDLIFQKATALFAITVGQTWPSDLKSVDDSTMTMSFDGSDVECSLAMLEKKQTL